MRTLFTLITLLGSLAACSPEGINYSSRVSEYERMMAKCPEGQERACQEEYEHTFAGGKH